MGIRFTRTARSQFNRALRFIASDNLSVSINFRARAEKSLERLKDYPNSGRSLPEFPTLPYQEIIVAPYRFFYKIEKTTVIVVGVWHSAQLPSQPQ